MVSLFNVKIVFKRYHAQNEVVKNNYMPIKEKLGTLM